jgi:hypothetical protein
VGSVCRVMGVLEKRFTDPTFAVRSGVDTKFKEKTYAELGT